MITGAPTDFSASGIKEWITRVSAEVGTTPTQLAKRAKVAPSTINKFLADPNPSRNISARTLSSLFEAAVEIASARQSTFKPLAITDEVPFDVILSTVLAIDVMSSKVDKALTLRPIYRVQLPVPTSYVNGNLFGIEIADNQSEPIYPQGTLLIVAGGSTRFRGTAIAGERVIATQDFGDPYLEISVREMVESPSGDQWLVGLPPGKSKLRDIYLGRGTTEYPDDVHILGRVIMSLQPEPSVYGGVVGERE